MTYLYQLILTVHVAFPGPVIEVNGHPVVMRTSNYTVALQGFATLADCEAYDATQPVALVLTNALGAVSDVTVTPAPVKCSRYAVAQ